MKRHTKRICNMPPVSRVSGTLPKWKETRPKGALKRGELMGTNGRKQVKEEFAAKVGT